MANILFIPSPIGGRSINDIGIGNVIRDLAITKEILRKEPSANVAFALPSYYGSSLVEKEGIGIVRLPSVRLNSPFFRYLYLLGRIHEACNLLKIDVAVADNFPEAIYISAQFNVPFICITDGTAYSMFELSLLHKASLIIISDIPELNILPEELKTLTQRIHFIGPILRPYRHLIGKSKEEVKKELSIDPNEHLIFITTGGGNIFPRLFKIASEALKTVKRMAPHITAIFNLGFRRRDILKHIDISEKVLLIDSYNPDILKYMAASDALITRGGFNTLMEAMVLGIPTIAVSTPLPSTLHRKELGNIERMKRLGPLIHLPLSMLSSERMASELLKPLSDKGLRRKSLVAQETLLKYDGSCRAADFILELCRKKSIHE